MKTNEKTQYALRQLPILMLAFIGFYANALMAQDTSNNSDSTDQSTYKNTLTISPLKLWIFSNVGPELTYQRMLSERSSVQLKAGYIYAHMLPPLNSAVSSAQGGRLGAEFKWFHSGTTSKGWYVGIEMDGGQISRSRSFYQDFGRHSYTYRYDVHTAYAAANIKLGYQVMYKRFFLDLFCGVGPRVVDVQYKGVSEREYEEIVEVDGGTEFTPLVAPNPLKGSYLSVAVPCNVMLGFAF